MDSRSHHAEEAWAPFTRIPIRRRRGLFEITYPPLHCYYDGDSAWLASTSCAGSLPFTTRIPGRPPASFTGEPDPRHEYSAVRLFRHDLTLAPLLRFPRSRQNLLVAWRLHRVDGSLRDHITRALRKGRRSAALPDRLSSHQATTFSSAGAMIFFSSFLLS
jgi:hypothetical protein